MKIPDAKRVRTVAVDEQRGVLWAYGPHTLRAYDFNGELLLRVPVAPPDTRSTSQDALSVNLTNGWARKTRTFWPWSATFIVRCGNIPQVLAALRNTVIGLLRWADETNIAAACRRFAAQPLAALALIGIEPEN